MSLRQLISWHIIPRSKRRAEEYNKEKKKKRDNKKGGLAISTVVPLHPSTNVQKQQSRHVPYTPCGVVSKWCLRPSNSTRSCPLVPWSFACDSGNQCPEPRRQLRASPGQWRGRAPKYRYLDTSRPAQPSAHREVPPLRPLPPTASAFQALEGPSFAPLPLTGPPLESRLEGVPRCWRYPRTGRRWRRYKHALTLVRPTIVPSIEVPVPAVFSSPPPPSSRYLYLVHFIPPSHQLFFFSL